MNIRENIESNAAESECENCLKNTKVAIAEFFKYNDCNDDGLVSAENVY